MFNLSRPMRVQFRGMLLPRYLCCSQLRDCAVGGWRSRRVGGGGMGAEFGAESWHNCLILTLFRPELILHIFNIFYIIPN
jgi:hypothetical protein